jgi:ABC-type uncharacterized transport system auxiliary subunit
MKKEMSYEILRQINGHTFDYNQMSEVFNSNDELKIDYSLKTKVRRYVQNPINNYIFSLPILRKF